MSTIQEITELRKNGDIDKAYQESKNLFKSNPEDKFARIALSQCIKALMDKAGKDGDASALAILLEEYGSLGLEEIGEAELNDKAAWDVRALMLRWKQDNTYDPHTLRRLAQALTTIDFVRPHRYYSVLLDAMIGFKDGNGNPWKGIISFINWWGLENFLPEDFERIRIHNGQTIPSLAERTYTVYVKALLADIEDGESVEAAESFLDQLDTLKETHPEFQYTDYHKTQLLKALRRIDEAVDSARAFVKRHQNQAWAWSMLGDIVDDDSLKLSCYCRALLCRTDFSFLVKIRRKAAELMIQQGDLANAKKEIELIIMTCEKKSWNIPADVRKIMDSEWYQETQAEYNNTKYYYSHLGPSEDFLCGDVPEKAIIIVKYNPQKGTCSFITEDRERGFFGTKKFHEQFADNQIYLARLPEGVDPKGATKVMSLQKVNDIAPYEGIFFRRHRAELNIKPGQTFTFIDDIYLDASMIPGIEPGDMIDITAVIFYNIKRASWGWRAVRVVPAT